MFCKLNQSVKDIVTAQFLKCGQELHEKKQQFREAVAEIERSKKQEHAQLQRTVQMLRKLYNGQVQANGSGGVTKIITCLEEQILLLKEAKEKYNS